MRRHLHWILLLLAVPISYVLIMLVVQWLSGLVADATAAGDDGGRLGLNLAGLAALVAALVVPLVLLIRAIVQMRRTYRRAQRAKGRFTAYEQSMLDRGRYAADAWERARTARTALLAHEIPPSVQQWDVVPYAGEVFFAQVPLTYARYYGRDVSYAQTSAVALGNPAFVVGALAVTAISNASARSRAAAQSAPQWREWQTSSVYISNRRFAVHAGGQWLSFDYSAMTAVFPEAAASTLVCQFHSAAPLLLAGDDAALACVFAVLQTHGVDALRRHPSLQILDQPAAQPTLPPIGRSPKPGR
ncbi:MAG: hypothetical protein QM568_09705 [Microbacterium sp.]